MEYRKNRHSHRRCLDVVFLSFSVVLTILLVSPAVSMGAAESKGAPVDLVTAIQQVAEQNIPAVVHIEVTERQEIANPLLPFGNDPFFQYFFGNPKMPKKFQRELVGLGTGMLMDDEGHILTNNHVVGGATKIQVLLADGRRFADKSIKLAGTDPKTDLAVIQIVEKGPFPHVTFGDSDKVGVGQWVVAIGHPRGLDQTVTQGIISAKHRRGISDPSSYQDFLQTDAAINPGNSGGPLLNLQGEVIGINAAIASESGGFEGIGFAIPSDMAVHIARELIAHGKVIRGWLGVSIQELTPELAQSFGLSTIKGALIADVEKGGPGEAAGLKRGDVVTAFQDKQVDDASSFRNAVAIAPIGQDAKISILRDGKKQDMTVKIGSQEEQEKKLALSLWERLGADVRAITSKEMERYGLESQQGVVIDKVDPKGPLGKAGFEKGDLILQINNRPIEGPEDLSSMLSSLPSRQQIVVLVVDHKSGEAGYVQVVLR
jgi:serine protease Do